MHGLRAGQGPMMAVKEKPEAVPRVGCGRPTWSASGWCVRCRKAPPARPGVVSGANGAPAGAAPVAVALDGHGRIAGALACLGCGYDLRGLKPEARCPECSTAVQRSIRGDRLCFCDPAWLGRLERGMGWVLTGLLAGLAVTIVMSLAIPILAPTSRAELIAAGLLRAVPEVLVVAGVWLLTTPDPARAAGDGGLTARAVARWCILAGLLRTPIEMIGQVAFAGPGIALSSAPSWLGQLLVVERLTLLAVGVAGNVAGLLYLAALARRLPRPGLARQTVIVAWGCGVPVAIAGVFMFWPRLVVFGAGALGLLLVLGVWALGLLASYRRAFRAAAEAARGS